MSIGQTGIGMALVMVALFGVCGLFLKWARKHNLTADRRHLRSPSSSASLLSKK